MKTQNNKSGRQRGIIMQVIRPWMAYRRSWTTDDLLRFWGETGRSRVRSWMTYLLKTGEIVRTRGGKRGRFGHQSARYKMASHERKAIEA